MDWVYRFKTCKWAKWCRAFHHGFVSSELAMNQRGHFHFANAMTSFSPLFKNFYGWYKLPKVLSKLLC